MKKWLSVILCLCLLACVPALAEDEDEVDGNSFLLKVWNQSGIEFSYLRFDFYLGEDYVGLICSCPNEGEDFYRVPYSAEDPEELEKLRIECSYGISDLSPEDAILQVMMGNPAEEHALLTLDFVPEAGQTYELNLVSDGEKGWMLVPAETVTEPLR